MSSIKTLAIGLGILAIGSASAYYTNVFDIQTKMSSQKIIPEYIPEIKNIPPLDKTIINQKTQFTLYFDFGCPHCREFYNKTYTELQSEYSEKNVDFTILPYSQKTVGKSFILAKHLLCIQKINPNKIDKFIQTVSITDDIKNSELFAKKIKILGLSEKENTDFFTCIKDEDKSTENKVLEIRTQAREKGVIGTPTFFINEKKFERNQSYLKVATILELILNK
ncbi:TPA: thioredoxin domain-containing protein [Candidatus Gracilibacteria bacterium]|nr:hypothetical protein [Candidatus Peregrinibacteria bacterium]HIQ56552.1 thioredoxin domain-containing protein [Candidatus Gracilibacteria bacterium]HIQ57081.1 thioredoxin domain-containing protein [Candidatus Gracilibacteria bacterium]